MRRRRTSTATSAGPPQGCFQRRGARGAARPPWPSGSYARPIETAWVQWKSPTHGPPWLSGRYRPRSFSTSDSTFIAEGVYRPRSGPASWAPLGAVGAAGSGPAVSLGLGRIIALYYGSSVLYKTHYANRSLHLCNNNATEP
jgi:hypothetical protein